MTYQDLWRKLTTQYDGGEARAIARLVMEDCFHLSQADLLCDKDRYLSPNDQQKLQEICSRLLSGEPVQYVLGHAWFGDLCFEVDEAVLIPRVETLELCHRIVTDTAQTSSPLDILDIGTGSGCIAVTLAKSLPRATLTAWDISRPALAVAQSNARRLEAEVRFLEQDALSPPRDHALWDVIVSNPPYIPHEEKAAMERHVLEHEPHGALFVPDDDPLLFYRSIAAYAMTALKGGGHLYFELNPRFAETLAAHLAEVGFEKIEIFNDQFDKQRFICAQTPPTP